MKIEEEIQLTRLIALRTKLDVYEQGTIDQMLLIFDKAVKDASKKLKRVKGAWTKKQQQKLNRELKEAYHSLSKLITGNIKKGVTQVGGKALDGMTDILSWDGKVSNFNVPLNRAAVIADAIENVPIGGAILSEWVDKAFDDTLLIQANVLASSLRGTGYREMYQALASVYPTFTRQELITLARTYNQSIVVAAQEKMFEENKDLVEKIRWTAVMEVGFKSSGRGTCPRCAGLDGQEYGLDESRPACPLHARCRCMWSPVTKSWNELFKDKGLVDKNGDFITVEEMEDSYRPFKIRKESNIDLGRRAGNVEKTIFTGGNYGDFITGEGKKLLPKVVGPNRARLIQEGKIKFEDIVNRKTGDLFTLEELGYPIRKVSKLPPKIPPKKPTSTISFKTKPGFDATKLKAKGYSQAESIGQAEQIASDMGMTAIFKGFQLEVANNINHAYARIKEAFPILEKQQMHIGPHNQAVKSGLMYRIEREIEKLDPHIVDFEFGIIQKELKVIKPVLNDSKVSKKQKKRYAKIYPSAAKLNDIIKKTGSETIPKSVQKSLIAERHVARAIPQYKKSYKAYGYTYSGQKDVARQGIVVANKKIRTESGYFQLYMRDCDSKYHPPLTASHWERAIYSHEFGHNVDGIVRQSIYKAEWEDFLQNIVKEHEGDFTNTVSRYANKNSKELVAEAIADVMDDRGGSELSNKIVNKLFKILEKLK